MSLSYIANEIRDHFGCQPIVCAELGVLYGESIPIFLRFNVQEYHGVDVFADYPELDSKHESCLMQNNGDQIYNSLVSKYADNPRVHIHKGFTNDVVKLFPDEYFDLVFIDANHEYDFVKADIALWYPKMKKGGFFCGDDYFYPSVADAVHEFATSKGLKVENSNSVNNDVTYGRQPWSWYIRLPN